MIEKRSVTQRKYTLLLTVFLSLCVLFACQDFFLPCDTPVCLDVEADGMGEVWLTSMEVNGQEISLDNVQLINNVHWQYNSEYDDYVYYPDNISQTNRLQMEVVGQQVRLYFAKNVWSGSVHIQTEGQPDVQVNLYTDETAEDDDVYQCQKKFIPRWSVFFSILELLLFLCFFLSLCLYG